MKHEKVLEAILTIVGGLLVFYFIFEITALIIIALCLIVLSLGSKLFARKVVWLWFKLSEVLGYISSRILLTAIFYLILFPIALLYKLFHKDNLALKRKTESYYTERDHEYVPNDLENPW